MPLLGSSVLRPPDPAGWWRTLTQRNGGFEWVYGLRVALAFGGPYVVAHVLGRLGPQSEIVAYAGLLVALSTHGLARHRQLRYSLGLAAVLPLVGLIDIAVAPPSLPHIGVLAVAGVVGGLSIGAPQPLPAGGLLFGLGVIMLPATSANLTTVWLALVGGLVAGLVLMATEPLLHAPRRSSDALSRILLAMAELFDRAAAGTPVAELHRLEESIQRSVFGAFELAGSDRHRRRLVMGVRDALDAFLLLDLTVRSAAGPPVRSLPSSLSAIARSCRNAAAEVGRGTDPSFSDLIPAIVPSLSPPPSDRGDDVPAGIRDRNRVEESLRVLIGHLQGWDTVEHDHVFNESSWRQRVAAAVPPLIRWHTVRLAIALTLAGIVAWAIGEHTGLGVHSNWMLLGLWLVLQTGANPTTQKAAQRAIGTTIGAVLTLALIPVLHYSPWSGYVIFGLTFVCFGIQYMNYAVYAVLLTPIAVVGFGGPSFDAGTIEARVLFTIAGCALAIVVRLVSSPGRYQEPLTDHLVVAAALHEATLVSALRAGLATSPPTTDPGFEQVAKTAWRPLSDLRLCHSGRIQDVPRPASADSAPVALHALLEVHHFALAAASAPRALSETEQRVVGRLADRVIAGLSAVGASPLRPEDGSPDPDASGGNLALVNLAWLTPELQVARARIEVPAPGFPGRRPETRRT